MCLAHWLETQVVQSFLTSYYSRLLQNVIEFAVGLSFSFAHFPRINQVWYLLYTLTTTLHFSENSSVRSKA